MEIDFTSFFNNGFERRMNKLRKARGNDWRLNDVTFFMETIRSKTSNVFYLKTTHGIGAFSQIAFGVEEQDFVDKILKKLDFVCIVPVYATKVDYQTLCDDDENEDETQKPVTIKDFKIFQVIGPKIGRKTTQTRKLKNYFA